MESKIIYSNALHIVSERIQDLIDQLDGAPMPGSTIDKIFTIGLLRLNVRVFYSLMKDQGHYLAGCKHNASLRAQINSFSYKKREFISLAQSVANQ